MTKEQVFTKHFSHVEITAHEIDVTKIILAPVWKDVDRPSTYSIVTPKKLADRMRRAFESVSAYSNIQIATEIGGQTYVCASVPVLGRHMNA